MHSSNQILSSIMRLSLHSSVIVSARDMGNDGIVSRACVIDRGAFSSGDALSSAEKYEQMRRVLSSASDMSEPVLSIISRRGDAKTVSYCLFSEGERSAGRWSRMSHRKARKPVIDTTASLRLWIAYPHMRYAKLPMS